MITPYEAKREHFRRKARAASDDTYLFTEYALALDAIHIAVSTYAVFTNAAVARSSILQERIAELSRDDSVLVKAQDLLRRVQSGERFQPDELASLKQESGRAFLRQSIKQAELLVLWQMIDFLDDFFHQKLLASDVRMATKLLAAGLELFIGELPGGKLLGVLRAIYDVLNDDIAALKKVSSDLEETRLFTRSALQWCVAAECFVAHTGDSPFDYDEALKVVMARSSLSGA